MLPPCAERVTFDPPPPIVPVRRCAVLSVVVKPATFALISLPVPDVASRGDDHITDTLRSRAALVSPRGYLRVEGTGPCGSCDATSGATK